MTHKHRTRRWFFQLCFLGLFIYLFMQTRYGVTPAFQTLFFRFDPLLLVVISIAYRTLLTTALVSLALLASTLLVGRYFCGFVCPLGTTLDICDTRHATKANRGAPKNIKYLILLFLIVCALLGSSFLHFFDPLVIMERTLTLLVYPILNYFVELFTATPVVVYTETLIALLLFATIIGLSFIAPRFWCRSVCPLGGMLARFSRFSLFKFSIVEGCTRCGICASLCPTGAIDVPSETIDSAECIDCLRCLYECPAMAIRYTTRVAPRPFDIGRRQIISALGASIIAVPLTRTLVHIQSDGRRIRPPGAIPEPDFMNVCIRCGKCMKVCPTNGLQPCILEAGINGLWTPKLVPRIGGCEKDCIMCGHVCPTSAIRKLPHEEKIYVKIGTAVIDRTRCIAWEQNKICLICDEACPLNAIDSRNAPVDNVTLLRPFVDEPLCTGCGLCEARCPIQGASAIQIFTIDEERKRSGSYITEEKIRRRALKDRHDDIPSGFIIE